MNDKKKLQEMLDRYKRYYVYHDFSAQFTEGDIDWLLSQAEMLQKLKDNIILTEQAENVEELESKSSNLRAMARDQRVAFRTFMRHHLHLAVEEGMLDLSDIDIESIIFFAEDDWSFLGHFIEFIKHYIKWNKENIWLKDDESSDEV